jgi:ribosome maturation factor RimP
LEVEDPIEQRYTLEVSSPGLDRPLRSAADFRRKVGEQVRLSIDSGGTQRQVEGQIASVEGDVLIVATGDSELRFDLADVVKGQILF